ncbi:MAG: flagellar biosynthesis protein FlhA [Pseudomonadales bacterium]|nr:flagellar biosynthesis protein FlhA [Pseudomonadales bacterium]
MTTNVVATPVGRFSAFSLAGIGTPILLLVMLALMILPLPAFVLDILFTFNIALSLLVLLASVYALRPLEFAVFPTVLLIATLLRLALNVASTRVVLLRGHEGTGAAGHVIEAFGDFVIGGNYAVGFVVFMILVIINFVVVTKGAGRVSEVTARFTLDAMPGKQMAIDADLNAGAITQDQARTRREEIGRESDFYGAMDGASKFVRGDAIAGILILFINVIGGFAIGMIYHNLSAAQAAENYVLLTIGDGLVAQVPSLLLSAATAILVTRVSDSQDMGQQVVSQLFASPKGLMVAGCVLLILGLIPGMPNIVFLLLAAGLLGAGYLIKERQSRTPELIEDAPKDDVAPTNAELSWEDVPSVDIIGLQVGYRLIPMVDAGQGGELLARIKGIRKKLSQDIGFLIQPVHIKDNLDLDPNQYRITMLDVPLGEGKVYPGKHLAINPGQSLGKLDGIRTTDPAFGLEAVWIEAHQRDEAQAIGYTVVDASTVIATHLSELLKSHAHDLLGHDEVQHLLDMLAESSPRLVENLVPKTLSLGVVLKVMQNLLEEGIPVRDIRSIAEALAEHAGKSQDPDVLTARVRVSLGRIIYQNINGMEPELAVMALEPKLEQILLQTISGNGSDGIEPGLAEKMMREVNESTRQFEALGKPPVLLVSSSIRQWLARLVRSNQPSLNVLAYEELPAAKKVKVVTTIGS